MNGLKAVDCLAVYLHENQEVRVFKYEKEVGFKGEYIVVNHLPFTFGQLVNSDNVLNVNIHVPALSRGGANVKRMTQLLEVVSNLIPNDVWLEEQDALTLDGARFAISSVSQPMQDKDGTYFLNVRIKLTTNNLII